MSDNQTAGAKWAAEVDKARQAQQQRPPQGQQQGTQGLQQGQTKPADAPKPQPGPAREAAPAAAPHRSEADIKAEREARIAASHGAQVVLDPTSEVALAARGALHGTMQGNLIARDTALVERAGGPVTIAHPPIMRDPVGDPEPDAVLAARAEAKPADAPKPA